MTPPTPGTDASTILVVDDKPANLEVLRHMLRDAGLVSVYMGIQSSERVTGHLYDRRVKNQSIEDIAATSLEMSFSQAFVLTIPANEIRELGWSCDRPRKLDTSC